MERPERRRPTFCSVRFAFARRSSLFCVPDIFLYLCLLCGSMCSMGSRESSKATLWCYTSIYDGIINYLLYSVLSGSSETSLMWLWDSLINVDLLRSQKSQFWSQIPVYTTIQVNMVCNVQTTKKSQGHSCCSSLAVCHNIPGGKNWLNTMQIHWLVRLQSSQPHSRTCVLVFFPQKMTLN